MKGLMYSKHEFGSSRLRSCRVFYFRPLLASKRISSAQASASYQHEYATRLETPLWKALLFLVLIVVVVPVGDVVCSIPVRIRPEPVSDRLSREQSTNEILTAGCLVALPAHLLYLVQP